MASRLRLGLMICLLNSARAFNCMKASYLRSGLATRFPNPTSRMVMTAAAPIVGKGRTFQFVPFGQSFSGDVKSSICVDGLVEGTGLHLSHWTGNQTPRDYVADLSTEISLRFVQLEGKDSKWKDSVVVNNHFDTDGLLSVWTLLEPEKALEHRDKLISAAAAGDFDEWSSDRGVQLNFAFLNLAKAAGEDQQKAYEIVLPMVEELLSTIDSRDDLWGEDMERLKATEDKWFDNVITTARVKDDKVREAALCVGADSEFVSHLQLASSLITPRGVNAPCDAKGCMQIRAAAHRAYERPHYAWVQTKTRPAVPPANEDEIVTRRLGFGVSVEAIMKRLGAGWAIDSSSLTTICSRKSNGQTRRGGRTTEPSRTGPVAMAGELLGIERSLLPRLA